MSSGTSRDKPVKGYPALLDQEEVLRGTHVLGLRVW